MEHVGWINTDDIVIANSTSEKMGSDILHYNIKEVRLLKIRSIYYFRYIVGGFGGEINWILLGNPESRKGVYYTTTISLKRNFIDELNNLYKELDREEKLNKLLE